MKETYMRRRKGEHQSRNIETRIRPLQPSLQPPRIIYPRIDWSNPNINAVITRPMYVPPLPEDREQFEMDNWMWLHDRRWGEWTGEWGTSRTFVPAEAESQSDIDNDAPVYKTPFRSYREPSESELDESESEDEEPHKEPRESTTIVQYVLTYPTGQFHKLRSRLKTRLVSDDCDADTSKSKVRDREHSQELGEMQRAASISTMKHQQVSSNTALLTGERRYTESQYR